jgi:sugar phosphate isomerase/epimerase
LKICYAYRRATYYPYIAGESWRMPDESALPGWLGKIKDIGFDGIELGLESLGGLEATERQVREIQKRLTDAGTPCVVVRAGGGLCQPNVAARNRARLEKAVQVASWAGIGTVNTALATPPRNRTLGSTAVGAPVQPGSGQLATEEDFIRTARVLHEVGEMAGDSGVNITIEVHQHAIADASWSTLHLLDLADSPYVFANPDLGNIYWNYDVPEESTEDAIVALAPRSKYWHCKNLHRVHIPEIEHSYYVRVPLPDGDIDYRFAISAMVEAGYDGYLAIEGANTGDQLYKDQRSFNYVKGILAELEA